MKFARLFELENGHQVLILKHDDVEENEYSVQQLTDFEDMKIKLSVLYGTPEERDKYFDIYDLSMAEEHRNYVYHIIHQNIESNDTEKQAN